MLIKIVQDKQIHIYEHKDQKLEHIKSYISATFKNVPQRYCLYYFDEDKDKIMIINDSDLQILTEIKKKTVKLYLEKVQKNQISQLTKELQINNTQIQEKQQEIEQIEKANQQIPNSNNEQRIKNQQSEKSTINNDKIEVLEDSFEKEKPKVIEHEAICSNCKRYPMLEVRYKCAFCINYDLCEECEQKQKHQHPMLKIRDPNLPPLKIAIQYLDVKEKISENKPEKRQKEEKIPQEEKEVVGSPSLLKTETIKFETKSDKVMKIATYLSNVLGEEGFESYKKFAFNCKSTTYEEALNDYIENMTSRGEAPKLTNDVFKWIKNTFNFNQ